MASWPPGLHVAAAWEASQSPYLAVAPAHLAPMAVEVPGLKPGESVELDVPLQVPPSSTRQVAWITLLTAAGTALTSSGSAPTQLANAAP